MTDIAVTVSLPPCAPDHPWASIPAAALARGVCPVCLGELDGERSARMIRARRLARLAEAHRRYPARDGAR